MIVVIASGTTLVAAEPTEPAGTNAIEAPVRSKSPIDEANYLTLGADLRRPFGDDYEAYYGGRAWLEFWTAPHHSVGMTVGAGGLHLKDDAEADAFVDDPWMLDFGFFYRFYFTRPNTFLRPYLTANLNMGTLYWGYRDELELDDYSYDYDYLGFFDGAVGGGLIMNLTKNFHLYGEANLGGVSFLGTTHHDFKNQFFDDFGYLAVKGGFGFTF